MENTQQAQISQHCYDRAVNRTFAVVKTREFTQTFYVSGFVPEDMFLAWVQPTIDRMMADLAA